MENKKNNELSRRKFINNTALASIGSLFLSNIPLEVFSQRNKLLQNASTFNAQAANENFIHFKIRNQAGYLANLKGSQPEQWLHAADQSLSNPNKIIVGQDVSMFWISDDGGKTWSHSPCEGIRTRYSVSVKYHPTDENIVLALMAMEPTVTNPDFAGIYRSIDGGKTWSFVKKMNRVVGGARDNTGIGDGGSHRQTRKLFTFDPKDSSIVYCVNPYDGLYRSEDSGAKWTKIYSDVSEMKRIFEIAIHPTNRKVIHVAAENGYYRFSQVQVGSTSTGHFKPANTGLPNGWVTSIDVEPSVGAHIVVAIYEVGIYVSTTYGNAQNGNNGFSALKLDSLMAKASVHRTDRNVIYALRRSSTNSSLVTSDGGATWTSIEPNKIDTTNIGYGFENSWKDKLRTHGKADRQMQSFILPHPTDSNLAIAHSGAALFRTKDRVNWINSGQGFCNLAWGYANTGNIWFDKNDRKKFIMFCFDVGARKTTNGGLSFSDIGSGSLASGLHSGQYSGSVHPTNSQRMVSTVGMYTKSTLAISSNSGNSWSIPNGISSNGENEKITWAAWSSTNANYIYCSTYVSQNSGSSFIPLNKYVTSGYVNGMRLIACAPSNDKIVYARRLSGGQVTIYKSTNFGKSFTPYYTVPYNFIAEERALGFTVHPGNPNKIFFPLSGRKIGWFDGTSNGTFNIGGNGDNFNSFRIDPTDHNIMYAFAATNGIKSMLYRSTNAGVSWQNITRNLPLTEACRNIEIHPTTGDVFIGGTVGTYILPSPNANPNRTGETIFYSINKYQSEAYDYK